MPISDIASNERATDPEGDKEMCPDQSIRKGSIIDGEMSADVRSLLDLSRKIANIQHDN